MSHILIIPSEEFVPEYEPLAGTFQLDQARILHQAGFQVGVISIRLKYSLPMILRGILNKSFLRKSGNATDSKSISSLLALLFKKLFKPESFIEIEKGDGINVYKIEGFYRMPPSKRNDYRWWREAGKVVFKKYIDKEGRPDIIHAHNAIYAGMLSRELKREYGISYMLTEHSSYFARELYHPSLLPKAYRTFNEASQLFVVSDFLGKGLENIFGPLSYSVLPNVVEPEFEYKPLLKNSRPYFLFISIGNLIPLKRHAFLINAFHKSFQQGEEVRLEIIGEGEEAKSLQNLIIALNETKRIVLKGRYSKKEILDVFNEANVLCLQSEYETFGVVVLEALFRGTPVITTRCGGPDNVVTEADGITIDVDDEPAMVKALIEMYHNNSKFNSDEIRKRAINRFGAKVFLSNLSKIFANRV